MTTDQKSDKTCIIIPPATKLGGVYWNHPVRPSVRLSVCPSVDARAVR